MVALKAADSPDQSKPNSLFLLAQAFGPWRDNAGVLMEPNGRSGEVVQRWDEQHARIVKLGQEIEKLDADYLRDTGTMIYTTKSKGKGNSVINIVRTTIYRPEASKTGR